jgi:hypothetical protein
MNSPLAFFLGSMSGAVLAMVSWFFLQHLDQRRVDREEGERQAHQMWTWFVYERDSLASYKNVGDVRRELQQHIAETVRPQRRATDKKAK